MKADMLPIVHSTAVGSVATVNPDGSPWNTPLHLAFDDERVVWLSDERAWHSQNIGRDPRVSIAIWSDTEVENVKGVYIQTTARRVEGMEEVAARQLYAARYGGKIPEKFVAGSTYVATIGDINTTKTRGGRLYFDG